MLCSVYLDGHKQNPSWCLQVRISPFIPPSAAVFAHCLASNSVGLKIASDSVPSPHSLPVKVFTVKWIKQKNSMFSYAICLTLGTVLINLLSSFSPL